MKKYKGSVAQSWLPTFENVSREFITETMYKILFSEELPNFRFKFKEQEAIDFIEKVLNIYTDRYDFYKGKAQKVIDSIKQVSKDNLESEEPVMIISDYKKFFESLRQFYDRDIELYFERTGFSAFTRYEKDNFFEQIWLRATSKDFKNPEEFLEKQAQMANDKTLEKYNTETYLGKISFLDDNILCLKNGIARTWDENTRECEITVYDKRHYNNKELFVRPHFTFPVIRYGIFEKNGKKICQIGSIQNKNTNYEQNELEKKVNRKKYKANEGVPEENQNKVEPKKLLALSVFINLLNNEGITEFELPTGYLLDYEYHKKRNKIILEEFNEEWTEEKIQKYPEGYKKSKYFFDKAYNKQDIISTIKSESFLLTFKRLLHHYPKGKMEDFEDEDSFIRLKIPKIKSEKDINGSIFRELYKLQSEQIKEI